MAIFDSILQFVINNWQSFITNIVAGLILAILVALFLVMIYRVPNFTLHLDYIPKKKTEKGISLPVLDISIFNKKLWIGFGKEDINFGLYIPIDFIIDKELHLMTTKGLVKWNVDTRGKKIFSINKEQYYLYRGVILMPVAARARTHFLRIIGNFDKDTTAKICYYFETLNYRFPPSLKFGKRTETAESGKLPCAEVKFN